jgi:hypothetical protein
MDMQPAPTFEPITWSVAGVIPEPTRFDDDATAARQRATATPTTGDTTQPEASPTGRNAASLELARPLSIIHGIGQDHHEVTARQSAAVPEQSMAEPAAPNTPAAPTTIAVLPTGV